MAFASRLVCVNLGFSSTSAKPKVNKSPAHCVVARSVTGKIQSQNGASSPCPHSSPTTSWARRLRPPVHLHRRLARRSRRPCWAQPRPPTPLFYLVLSPQLARATTDWARLCTIKAQRASNRAQNSSASSTAPSVEVVAPTRWVSSATTLDSTMQSVRVLSRVPVCERMAFQVLTRLTEAGAMARSGANWTNWFCLMKRGETHRQCSTLRRNPQRQQLHAATSSRRCAPTSSLTVYVARSSRRLTCSRRPSGLPRMRSACSRPPAASAPSFGRVKESAPFSSHTSR